MNPPGSPAQNTPQAPSESYRTLSLTASEPPPPQFATVADTPKKPNFELRFQVGQQSKNKIKISEQGTFKLVIEAAPSRSSDTHDRDELKDHDRDDDDKSAYHILDRDTTDDGIARITVPAAQLQDIYLHLKNPFEDNECEDKHDDKERGDKERGRSDDKNKHPECQSNPDNTSLQVSDALYLVNQNLTPATSHLWYVVPRRPLPVPADWYSPDQNKYVLTFQNHGVKGFVTRWFKQTGQPEFPQSVRVIPKVDCVEQNLNGTFTAYLGYTNQMPGVVNLPVGLENRFEPGLKNRGQPTQFAVGASAAYPQSPLAVAFKDPILTWTLNQHSVTVNAADESNRCHQDQAITISQNVAVRKRFIEPQAFTITSGNQASFTLPFTVSDPSDLKRRILVNLFNGTQRVERAEVLINGNIMNPYIDDQNLLNQNMPGMLAQAFGSIHQGDNQLQLKLQGPVGSSVQLSLEGFMMPVDIPNALHSRLSRFGFEKSIPHEKGRLRVKFTEGMKVRLHDNSEISKRLVDENGINLFLMEVFLKTFDVQNVQYSHNNSPDAEDALEQQREQSSGIDIPNRNLDYDLFFDTSKDVWQMVEILRGFPFIEEASPEFTDDEVQSVYQPNEDSLLGPCIPEEDVQLPFELSRCVNRVGGFPQVAKNQWLINTRILNGDVNHPALKPGAWDITQGASSINIFDLEGPSQRTHEDLGNILYINNLLNPEQVSGGRVQHATQTVGVLGATADNNKGIAGIAHHSKIYNLAAVTGTSACKGTHKQGCIALVDSLQLAQNEGAHVIEIPMGSAFFGTLEQRDARIRSKIQELTSGGISVIMSSGNDACDVSNSDAPNAYTQADIEACKRAFPNGRDVRRLPLVKDVVINQPPLPLLILPFGPLVYALYALLNPVKTGVEIIGNEPMIDTGSIVVGGVKIDNSNILSPTYSYGKTLINPSAPIFAGHGIDISAPAESVWTTTSYDNDPHSLKYYQYGGTSSGSAIVAGIVGLMLSQKESLPPGALKDSLTPRRIRDILRDSEQPLTAQHPADIPGMVDGFKAVCNASGYDDLQACKNGFHINSDNGGGNPSPSPSSQCDPNEQWYARAYNVDNTATAYVNLNNVLSESYQGDSGFVPINAFLQPGQNQVRFTLFNEGGGYTWGFQLKKNDEIYYQNEAGQAGIVGANNNDQTKPNQFVFDHTENIDAHPCEAQLQPGLKGTVYANPDFTPPVASSKIFNDLVYVGAEERYGDYFGVGFSDNFSIRFDGFLKLPPGYHSGTYNLILGFDDGAELYINNTYHVGYLGHSNFASYGKLMYLEQGKSYPIKVLYQEYGGEAELLLEWMKADVNGNVDPYQREPIPASAFSH